MKSKILFLIVCMLFAGCSTSPKKEMIQDAEIFLKSTLNDPRSYQPESFIIKDTLTVYEYEKNATKIDLESAEFFIDINNNSIKSQTEILRYFPSSGMRDYYLKELQEDRHKLDSLQIVKDRLTQKNDSLNNAMDDGSIKFIYLLANYRATNSFNALIKEETEILYHYKEKAFEILPE